MPHLFGSRHPTPAETLPLWRPSSNIRHDNPLAPSRTAASILTIPQDQEHSAALDALEDRARPEPAPEKRCVSPTLGTVIAKPNAVRLPAGLEPQAAHLGAAAGATISLKQLTEKGALLGLEAGQRRKLVEYLGTSRHRLAWRDATGVRHTGVPGWKKVLGLGHFWQEHTGIEALILHAWEAADARLLARLMADGLSADPKLCASRVARRLPARLLVQVLAEVTRDMTSRSDDAVRDTEAVYGAECLVAQHLQWRGGADPAKVKANIEALFQATAGLELEGSAVHKGVLLGILIAGALKHCHYIKWRAAVRNELVKTVGDLVWASSALIPVAGPLVGLGAVIATGMYRVAHVPRDYSEAIHKMTAALGKEVMTRHPFDGDVVQSLAFCRWLDIAIEASAGE